MDHRMLDLLAGLSHELRTPLGAIAGYAELLRLGAHGPVPDAQSELLGRIIRNQQAAVEILDAVLAFGNASSGAVTLHPVDASVGVMLEQAVDACAPLAAARKVSLRFIAHRSVEALMVRVDKAAAHVVLTGMLRDAVHVARTGESVEVTVSAAEDVVSVGVSHGTHANAGGDSEALFTPFARGHAQRYASGSADALALPCARALARASGGDMVRIREGESEVLRLTLPRTFAAVPAAD